MGTLVSIDNSAIKSNNQIYRLLIQEIDSLATNLADLEISKAEMEMAKLKAEIKLRKLEQDIADKIIRYD